MENIILSGMLKDFVTKHALQEEPSDRQFEKFANYCLLKTDHYDSFDFEKVGTGECVGVDGVAVSIGGVIVNEIADAENLTRAQYDAKFTFSQAKTSSKFDLGDYLKFISTVRNFFGEDKTSVPPELHSAFDIKEHIYKKSSAKLRNYPSVELSYVYAGRFDTKNSTLQQQIEQEVKAIREIPYKFSGVDWHVYDGDAIARLYRETQNDVLIEIPFQRHVALPKINGARSAYLGVVKCSDYVRMITKENGDLNKGLFFENVRDFLGVQNPVNEDIAKTINHTDERDRFAILNNGVTVVAKSVTPSGDTFRISQFQVVNGCQTSHVLFNNQKILTGDMYLTVKLIETSDVDLSGQIIATTNSQSQVTKEAFATIRPYHRIVEDFFNAMRSSNYGYYYERRPHQYDDRDDILQQYIVSAPSLIKSFVSTVLEEPHKVHYYYGTLLSEYNKNQTSELFSDDDYPGIYFAAHHITFKTKGAAIKDRQLKEWSFHLALLIKKALAPELKKGASLNDKKFLEILKRIDDNFDETFKSASNFLKQQSINEKQNRIETVTEDLISKFMRQHPGNKGQKADRQAPDSSELKLSDGRYVGTLQEINANSGIATVKYGPFTISGKISSPEVGSLPIGARLPFTASKGTIEISKFDQ